MAFGDVGERNIVAEREETLRRVVGHQMEGAKEEVDQKAEGYADPE